MARESREVWTKRVERWRASGLTADEFASEVGIKSNSLRHWSWLLDHEKRGSRPDAARRARTREVPLVEVVTRDANTPHVPVRGSRQGQKRLLFGPLRRS